MGQAQTTRVTVTTLHGLSIDDPEYFAYRQHFLSDITATCIAAQHIPLRWVVTTEPSQFERVRQLGAEPTGRRPIFTGGRQVVILLDDDDGISQSFAEWAVAMAESTSDSAAIITSKNGYVLDAEKGTIRAAEQRAASPGVVLIGDSEWLNSLRLVMVHPLLQGGLNPFGAKHYIVDGPPWLYVRHRMVDSVYMDAGGNPVCMDKLGKVFGVTRIPKIAANREFSRRLFREVKNY